jgi:four helix bundle protein
LEGEGWERGGGYDGVMYKVQGTRYKVQGTRDKGQGTRHKGQEQTFFDYNSFMSQELEDRFHNFGKRVRDFCRLVKWDIINVEYIKQLIRASSSIGANYIEASDDLGKADEKMKIKISRREAKESLHFLNLILTYGSQELERERDELVDEAQQIRKILSTIVIKLDKDMYQNEGILEPCPLYLVPFPLSSPFNEPVYKTSAGH